MTCCFTPLVKPWHVQNATESVAVHSYYRPSADSARNQNHPQWEKGVEGQWESEPRLGHCCLGMLQPSISQQDGERHRELLSQRSTCPSPGLPVQSLGSLTLWAAVYHFFNSISKGLVRFSTYDSRLTVCLAFLQVESEVSGSLCMAWEDYFIATNPTGLEVNPPSCGVTHARLADAGGHLSPFASSEKVPLRWENSFCV